MLFLARFVYARSANDDNDTHDEEQFMRQCHTYEGIDIVDVDHRTKVPHFMGVASRGDRAYLLSVRLSRSLTKPYKIRNDPN